LLNSRFHGVGIRQGRRLFGAEALAVKKILKEIPLPRSVKNLLRKCEKQGIDYLRDFLKEFLRYCLNEEFNKARYIVSEIDSETLKFFVPFINEREFLDLKNYLLKVYQYALEYYSLQNEIVKALTTSYLEKLPEKKLKKEEIGRFLTFLKNRKEGNKPKNSPKGYRNLGYRVALFLDENLKVKDARIFATKDTLLKFRYRAGRQKLYILVQPNPIKIPKAFWEEYRKSRNPSKRVKLIQKYGLLKDENAFYGRLLWDLDSPYEEVEKVFEEFLKDLNVEKRPFLIQLEKTASGRARLIIPIAISLDAQKKHGNGHTHLENIREALSIVASYFQQKGINVDLSFIDRPNHQIWDRVAHPKNGTYEITGVVYTLRRIKFYDLYNRLKKLQREKGLYYLKRGNKEINLTTYFRWRPEFRKNKKAKVLKVPKFIAERLESRTIENLKEDVRLYYWKKAVKALAENATDHRYNRVIRPAVGWAKYLDLDRYEVESYLKEVLSDRDSRKNDHDIETAYREAPELEFKLPKGIRTLNFKAIVKETLKALSKGTIPRQELIKLLGHQKWLVDLIMRAFEKVGLTSHSFEKKGKGRPQKVFFLTEKGRFIADNLTEEVVNSLWREAIAVGQDFVGGNNHQVKKGDFSQYKNSPSLKVEDGSTSPTPGECYRDLRNLTNTGKVSISKAGERAQMPFVCPKGAPEVEGKASPPEEKKTPPRDKKDIDRILDRLRNRRPKRGGGISSIGEILGFE